PIESARRATRWTSWERTSDRAERHADRASTARRRDLGVAGPGPHPAAGSRRAWRQQDDCAAGPVHHAGDPARTGPCPRPDDVAVRHLPGAPVAPAGAGPGADRAATAGGRPAGGSHTRPV